MQDSRFGPYELVATLGAGGMAETFLAVRRGPAGFEQRVCLKRILPGYAGDQALIDLFLDEARLVAHLRSGNIVQVHDFGQADGTYYMALELVEGADLQQLLSDLSRRRECVSERVALYIVAQVLNALEYAHSASLHGEPLGIVHRDVSPSNILINNQGEVKLTDFGIAKARGRKHKTRTGHTKGKVAYMAPEQVRGEALDGRCDLFAVGIVLYELLSGAHPFDADTDLALLNNILTGKRAPLESLAPGASQVLSKLVNELLAPEPQGRPATAGEVLTQLPAHSSMFAAKRELAELVQRYRASAPQRPVGGSAHPDHAGTPPRSGSTGALSPSPTRSQRVASPSHTASGADGRRSQRALWTGVGLLALIAMGGALFVTTRQGPGSPGTSGLAASEPRVPTPISPPAPAASAPQQPAVTAPSAPPPGAPPAPTVAPEGTQVEARGSARERDKVASSSERALHESPAERARRKQRETAAEQPTNSELRRTRSGLSVSTEDF